MLDPAGEVIHCQQRDLGAEVSHAGKLCHVRSKNVVIRWWVCGEVEKEGEHLRLGLIDSSIGFAGRPSQALLFSGVVPTTMLIRTAKREKVWTGTGGGVHAESLSDLSLPGRGCG